MRPDWNEYFMSITELVAGRATCLRRKVGAVVTKENRVLATGYNGAPSGMKHCLETGCMRDKLKIPSGERQELCRGIHAEQNAIVQAAKFGISLDGGTIYCTTRPCITCAKLIINAGIKKVVFREKYADDLAIEFLNEAGIEMVEYESPKKENG